MNMKDKLNIYEFKSTPDMKGPENLSENHTVIQTRRLIQLQT